MSEPKRIYVKLRAKNNVPKTILSIDGGGMRGLVAARFAESIEDAIRDRVYAKLQTMDHASLEHYDLHWWEGEDDKEGRAGQLEELREALHGNKPHIHLADYFDIMAGTSTGSVLATYFATKGGQALKNILIPMASAGGNSAGASSSGGSSSSKIARLKEQTRLKEEALEKCVGHVEKALRKQPPDAESLLNAVYDAARDAAAAHLAEYLAVNELDVNKLVPGSASAAQAMFVAAGRQIFSGRVVPANLPPQGQDFLEEVERYIRTFTDSFNPVVKRLLGMFVDLINLPSEVRQTVQNAVRNLPALMLTLYPAHGIEETLKAAFGQDTLFGTAGVDSGLRTCLVVPSFQVDTNRATVFYAAPGGVHGYVQPVRGGPYQLRVSSAQPEPAQATPGSASLQSEGSSKGPEHKKRRRDEINVAGFKALCNYNSMFQPIKAGPQMTAASGKVKLTKDGDAEVLPESRVADASTVQSVEHFKRESLNLPLWEVVRCSTAAPAFFPGHKLSQGEFADTAFFVDGGLVANNPTADALAFAAQQFSSARFAVLSLGCGTLITPLGTGVDDGGVSWLFNFQSILFGSSNELSTANWMELMKAAGVDALRVQATMLVAGTTSARDLPSEEGPSPWAPALAKMDDPTLWHNLQRIGKKYAEFYTPKIIAWVEKNLLPSV